MRITIILTIMVCICTTTIAQNQPVATQRTLMKLKGIVHILVVPNMGRQPTTTTQNTFLDSGDQKVIVRANTDFVLSVKGMSDGTKGSIRILNDLTGSKQGKLPDTKAGLYLVRDTDVPVLKKEDAVYAFYKPGDHDVCCVNANSLMSKEVITGGDTVRILYTATEL